MARHIRLATEYDAAAVAAIYAPFCEASVVSFEYTAPTADEMAGRIRTVTAQLPWLVINEGDERDEGHDGDENDDGGMVTGYVYAAKHHERAAYGWAVNTAVYIGEGYRRRGAGRALYTALFDLLRLQGYYKACAGVTLPNPASVALHQSMGFLPVGVYRGIGYKKGGWHDVAWYELALQPERLDPPAPRLISAIMGTEEWHRILSNAANT
jgi:L-amino acid N-acyltransferase YncA